MNPSSHGSHRQQRGRYSGPGDSVFVRFHQRARGVKTDEGSSITKYKSYADAHLFFITEQCTDTARLRENVLMPIVFIGIELISLCFV